MTFVSNLLNCLKNNGFFIDCLEIKFSFNSYVKVDKVYTANLNIV